MNEEEIKKFLIMDMIVDKLFMSLIKGTRNGKPYIHVESYKIDEKDMTYLLKKYDENRFKMYEETLLEGEEDDE